MLSAALSLEEIQFAMRESTGERFGCQARRIIAKRGVLMAEILSYGRERKYEENEEKEGGGRA